MTTICSVDLTAERENERREFIRCAATSDECFVAERGKKVIGYGVFNHSFYDIGFIEMIYIQIDCQRSGCSVGETSRIALPNSKVLH